MIKVTDGVFQLDTAHTSYLFEAKDGLLRQLYYGPRITLADPAPLRAKTAAGYGCEVFYRPGLGTLALDSRPLECAPMGKGDFRRGMLSVESAEGFTADLTYQGYTLAGALPQLEGLPGPHGADGCLIVTLADRRGLTVELVYGVFEEADVILRTVRVKNETASPLTLLRALSFQLDLPGSGWTLTTLDGAWARERMVTEHRLGPGAVTFGSRSGTSSNKTNPFFFLCEDGAGEFFGRCYGCNLIYSGSFEGSAELSTMGFVRLMEGVQSDGFSWPLRPGERFDAPWGVLTCSDAGKNGMSQNMHRFIKGHILPPAFAEAERPVVLNNWEATYHDFNERRLLRLARQAAAVGVELFVLDDGWFGARDSDRAGLGDYAVNRKKLPGGLAGLAEKINALGMEFGLWMEPEMVNRDSDLYRAHPDWAVAVPGVEPSEGRNQLVLDLCRAEVRDYIVEQVVATIRSANIKYVKWDMNRHLSDCYSPALDAQGRFGYRFTQGVYDLFARITAACPEVLFEGCASGGNRFDLGVLCYMPQIWTSDDTDAYQRQLIQTGTSYGYPPCVMAAHVSASPNHQAARQSPLEGRFDVAAFGVLGYELDLTVASPAEKKVIREQIAWYKAHRRLLQQGAFYRLKSPFGPGDTRGLTGRETQWMVVSPDRSEAVVGELMGLMVPNSAKPPLRLCGLDPDRLYEMQVRREAINIKTFGSLINQILPVRVNTEGILMHTASEFYMMPCEEERYTAYGDLLMRAGVNLQQAFTGTGYNDAVRLMPDFSGRLYWLRALPPPVEVSRGEREENCGGEQDCS